MGSRTVMQSASKRTRASKSANRSSASCGVVLPRVCHKSHAMRPSDTAAENETSCSRSGIAVRGTPGRETTKSFHMPDASSCAAEKLTTACRSSCVSVLKPFVQSGSSDGRFRRCHASSRPGRAFVRNRIRACSSWRTTAGIAESGSSKTSGRCMRASFAII